MSEIHKAGFIKKAMEYDYSREEAEEMYKEAREYRPIPAHAPSKEEIGSLGPISGLARQMYRYAKAVPGYAWNSALGRVTNDPVAAQYHTNRAAMYGDEFARGRALKGAVDTTLSALNDSDDVIHGARDKFVHRPNQYEDISLREYRMMHDMAKLREETLANAAANKVYSEENLPEGLPSVPNDPYSYTDQGQDPYSYAAQPHYQPVQYNPHPQYSEALHNASNAHERRWQPQNFQPKSQAPPANNGYNEYRARMEEQGLMPIRGPQREVLHEHFTGDKPPTYKHYNNPQPNNPPRFNTPPQHNQFQLRQVSNNFKPNNQRINQPNRSAGGQPWNKPHQQLANNKGFGSP